MADTSTTHILYDFFGTLVHYSPSRTEQGYERSFTLLQAAGATLDYDAFLSLWSEIFDEYEDLAERSHREFSMVEVGEAFLHRAFGEPLDRMLDPFLSTYLEEWNKGVRYLDALPAMLERMSDNFTLAIITNTHEARLVHGHLGRMGVANLFDRVITSVEVGTRKPAPGIFEYTLRELDVQADRCLYVGDNYEADFVGARSVGMQALLIDPAYQAPVSPANRLTSVLDLEMRLHPIGPSFS